MSEHRGYIPETCACGCGGTVKPGRKWLPLHHLSRLHESIRGAGHPRWAGGRQTDNRAGRSRYVLLLMPGHPRANRRGYVAEHLVVAGRALGRPIPPGCDVHHVNEDGRDNRPDNLVICESRGYHMLLHQRLRALRECGNPDWLRCAFCSQYSPPDDPDLRSSSKPTVASFHRSCRNAYGRAHMRRRADAKR